MPHRILKGLKVISFVVVVAVLLGLVTMELWNALLPQIFKLPRITFWQGLGLLVLSKILFGGFHRHSGHRDQWKQRMRSRMRDRWESMTPEDREKFRKGMRCGRNPFAHHEDNHETQTAESRQ